VIFFFSLIVCILHLSLFKSKRSPVLRFEGEFFLSTSLSLYSFSAVTHWEDDLCYYGPFTLLILPRGPLYPPSRSLAPSQ